MSHLVLEVRPGETMLVNGATIRFRTRTRIELLDRARFLLGRQVLREDEARGAVGRVILALQRAYAGRAEERVAALTAARAAAPAIGGETGAVVLALLARFEAGEEFAALREMGAVARASVAG